MPDPSGFVLVPWPFSRAARLRPNRPLSPDRAADRHAAIAGTDWLLAVAIATGILVFYLVLAPWTTLWDRDEARFAGAAVEMVRSGDYLVPSFNGEPRLQKPIFIYWLMSLTIRALGPTELAVRFWAPVGVAVTALFTFVLARQFVPRRTAATAMLVLVSNPLIMLEGVSATTDAVLLACMTGALVAFATAMARGPSAILTVGLSVALSCAQLTKGPIGIAIPLAIMVGTLWLSRGRSHHGSAVQRMVIRGSLLSLLVVAAWAIPATFATDGRLLSVALGHELLLRAVTPLESHGGHLVRFLPFYPLVITVGFIPWTLYVPTLIGALALKTTFLPEARPLLLVWVTLPILAFTLAATKLPQYILPIWPALALGVAAVLDASVAAPDDSDMHRWLRLGVWLHAPVAALTTVLLLAVAWLAPDPSLRSAAVTAAMIVLLFSIATVRAHMRGEIRHAASHALAGVLAFQLVVGLWLLAALEPFKPVPRLAEAINDVRPLDVPILTHDFDEPSLLFYLDRRRITNLASAAAVDSWYRQRAPGILILTRTALDRLMQTPGPLDVEAIAEASGINYSKGTRVELVAIESVRP